MGERLSAEELDAMEAWWVKDITENDPASPTDDYFNALFREVRAAWAESEALKEALRDLLDAISGRGILVGFDDEAVARARALVGSVPQPAKADE